MKAISIVALIVIAGVGGLIWAYAAQAKQEPLQPGTVAPGFALPDQHNTVHQLSESKGKIVVLAFYPADMTKGCSLEANNFTNALPEFEKRDVVLYGISVQDVESKKKFCNKEDITYPLLADVKKQTTKDYGVLSALGVAKRVTFVIDKKGNIAAIDPDVKPATVVKDTLEMVDAVIAQS